MENKDILDDDAVFIMEAIYAIPDGEHLLRLELDTNILNQDLRDLRIITTTGAYDGCSSENTYVASIDKNGNVELLLVGQDVTYYGR